MKQLIEKAENDVAKILKQLEIDIVSVVISINIKDTYTKREGDSDMKTARHVEIKMERTAGTCWSVGSGKDQ